MTKRLCLISRPLLVVLLMGMALTSPLSVAAPDPDAMARQPLPEHQADATYRGKTAMEHAEALIEPSRLKRILALERLQEIGVDALPARDAVRYVFEQGDTEGLAPRQLDRVRVAALKTLFAMQAPEAEALLREAILDPAFSEHSSIYRHLVLGAVEMGIDEATLPADMLALADEDGAHAARLMATEVLPEMVLHSLAEALFHQEHGATASRFFLSQMGELDVVDDASWLAYVRDHAGLAKENPGEVLAALADIGTRDALRDEISRPASAHLANLMENFARELSNGAAGPDTSPLAEVARSRFIAAMASLLEQGQSDDHRLVGLQRLVRHQQRHPRTPPAMTLGPPWSGTTPPNW